MFRGSCLATFNEKPECTKDSGFFDASVNGSNENGIDKSSDIRSIIAFSMRSDCVNCHLMPV